ncbi:MAG: sigma-70 family RNA polymerase sigma factor [Clostridiales bacterium]|nr:sigma-70 family RNA polymerase sigma factor [Clostridiales bacterium]
MKGTKGGDFITEEEYFEYLMDTYGNLVYSICYKTCGNPFDAEDLTQDVFLSAYRNLFHFDRSFEKAWICKIASRKCLDFLKAASRRILPAEDTFIEDTSSGNMDTSGSPVEEAMLETETRQRLLAACRQLKPPYNEVARLHFYEEMTAAEIAAIQQENLKTVQTRIYRAKAMLKKSLQTEHKLQQERSKA